MQENFSCDTADKLFNIFLQIFNRTENYKVYNTAEQHTKAGIKLKKKIIGYYDYTVVLTYVGMLCACAGIFSAIDKNTRAAAVLLTAAGVCDLFDGAVASTKKRTDDEKRFGIQIDSLCDLISFGALPAVIAYTTSPKPTTGIIAALYTLTAVIRLAYFNVAEETRQKGDEKRRKTYLGVPVTVIAIILPGAVILGNVLNVPLITLSLVPMGIGYISPLDVPKPRIKGLAVLVLIMIAECVVLFLTK